MNKVVPLLAAALFLAGAHDIYSQSMMRMYRSVYSVAGFYGAGRSSTDVDQGFGVRTGGNTDTEVLRFSTRNGYFVARQLAFGLEFMWEQHATTYAPDPNPVNFRSRSHERRLFVGPWVRWYIPASVRWYAALELSAGYAHALTELEESTSSYVLPGVTTSANGYGVNAGIGMGYFLSRGIVLDATARYGAGWLNGEYRVPGRPDRDLNMDFGEITFLLGVQLLL